jgi:uncharacterized membrane protein YkoI
MRKNMRAAAIGLPLLLTIVSVTASWVSAEPEQHTSTATTKAQAPAPQGTIVIRTAQERDFPSLAKVSLPAAMRIALGQVPGDVLKAETKEKSGFLVHEVEVVAPDDKSIMEFVIDAGTGAILRQSLDQPDDDEPNEHEDDEDED